MRSKIITIGTVLLFIAWLLAQAFFSAPAEQDPVIGVPVAKICVAFFLAGIVLLMIRMLFLHKHTQKQNSEKIGNLYLKTYGRKIRVDLSLCKVFNATDKIVIECQMDLQGQVRTFLAYIEDQGLKEMQQKITNKKYTLLYIDNKDINKYYLDVEFLQ